MSTAERNASVDWERYRIDNAVWPAKGDKALAINHILVVPQRCRHMPSLGYHSTRERSTKTGSHKLFDEKISGSKDFVVVESGRTEKNKDCDSYTSVSLSVSTLRERLCT